MKEDQSYKYFITALRYTIDNKGYGIKTALAADSELSLGFISQIVKEGATKKAGFNAQVALAKACGYQYEDFLALGRELLRINSNTNQKVTQKQDVDVKVGDEMADQSTMALLQHYTEELKALREEIKFLREENRELKRSQTQTSEPPPETGDVEKKTA